MRKSISPSMMCADIFHLGAQLKEFEASGVEYLHIDIMDGVFVPNYTLGTDFAKKLKEATAIPLDIHLMIERPEERLAWFTFGEGDYVSVHAETTKHLQRVLTAIRARGARPMVAINPATPLSAIEYVLDDIDAVLVMTVNPGYAGQKLVPATLAKIRDLREMLNARGYDHVEIEVDGNVSLENARKMSEAGANIFVVGTASLFHPDTPSIAEGVARLREATK